ncbi:MAG: transcription elongation factor GreA [Rickettsiales bacterium]|jgi:transcription elongation factor GreA|nr:transcription elongation factor GreA [Rickettsiales bacterium]
MARPISQAGMDALRAELGNLKDFERPPVMLAVQAARDLGDLKENDEYQSARSRQRLIDRRIRELECLIKDSRVMDICGIVGDAVVFGAVVELEDEAGRRVSYQLLSDTESDIAAGKISVSSPIGRALLGKKKGDLVEINVPSGKREFEIISVKFA